MEAILIVWSVTNFAKPGATQKKKAPKEKAQIIEGGKKPSPERRSEETSRTLKGAFASPEQTEGNLLKTKRYSDQDAFWSKSHHVGQPFLRKKFDVESGNGV